MLAIAQPFITETIRAPKAPAPMATAERKAISLFSGAGGMDIGVRNAGFDILAAIEFDKHCCATLAANANRQGHSVKIMRADIRTVAPNNLLNDLSLKRGEVDLLFGGPPCQSFSLAGKQKGLGDDRGLLLFEIVRFAKALQPKVIFLEQVKGLLASKGAGGQRGEVFEKFLAELSAINYAPKWRLVMAADYGVPQIRERLFVVATRGQNGFSFPEKTHTARGKSGGLFAGAPHVGIGKVLGGLGRPDPKILGTTLYDRADSHVDVTPHRDRERIAHVPEGSHLSAQTHLSKSLRCNLSPKDTTKYLRLHRDKPANTLRCGEIFYHPTEDRYLTPREYMRIHGYPDSYVLKGPIRSRTGVVPNLDQHRQIANSVPPPLANTIASQIKAFLDEQDI